MYLRCAWAVCGLYNRGVNGSIPGRIKKCLGTFRKITEKAAISFMSVRSPAWKNSAVAGPTFVNYDILIFFEMGSVADKTYTENQNTYFIDLSN